MQQSNQFHEVLCLFCPYVLGTRRPWLAGGTPCQFRVRSADHTRMGCFLGPWHACRRLGVAEQCVAQMTSIYVMVPRHRVGFGQHRIKRPTA